jgi:hypothetical protein
MNGEILDENLSQSVQDLRFTFQQDLRLPIQQDNDQ